MSPLIRWSAPQIRENAREIRGPQSQEVAKNPLRETRASGAPQESQSNPSYEGGRSQNFLYTGQTMTSPAPPGGPQKIPHHAKTGQRLCIADGKSPLKIRVPFVFRVI